MKINHAQLTLQLKKNLAPYYVITGDELLLKQDAIDAIRNAVKNAGFDERISIQNDTAGEVDSLYTLLNNGSLFTEKKYIELDFRETLPNKQIAAILESDTKHPSPDRVLLIQIGKVDQKILKSSWYHAIEKIGLIVSTWPIPQKQIPEWIRMRASQYQITLSKEAAELIADYTEGHLMAAAKTIEKIRLIKPQKIVDVPIIKAILSDESHFNLFDLTDALLSRNGARILHIINRLKLDQIEPILILWAITRELRILAKMQKEVKQGANIEHLFEKYKIFYSKRPFIQRFLNTYSEKDCWSSIEHASKIDQIIKGGRAGNPWHDLTLLCLRWG